MVTTRTLAAVVATLALATLLAPAAGAADEVFTLADGRTFVGAYDAEAGQLHTRIGAKDVAIAVTAEQITERAPFDPKKAPKVTPATPTRTVVEKPKADPNAMKPEEKAAAERDFARATKLREADDLDAAANKMTRDAASAVGDAKHQRDQSRRDAEKFRERTRREEGWEPTLKEAMTQFYALKKTSGNNQAAVDCNTKADAAETKAADLTAQAAAKHAQAAAVRAAADAMPHGD